MYNELYAAWHREIESNELTPLPADFYTRVSDYLRRIREETRMIDKKTLKASLLEREMLNTEHLVRELTRTRYRKLKKAISENHKIPSELLTAEEERMCGSLLSFTQAYNVFAKTLLHGQAAKIETGMSDQPLRLVVLRFAKSIPAVVGSDLKTYGPFSAEDVASLPIENARLLVKQGLAAMVEFT